MPEPAEETKPRFISEMEEFFGEPISVYTRAEAIDDGVLVDVTESATEDGFKIPVAMTRTAWMDAVAVPEGYVGAQSVAGRLHDVLFCARMAAKRADEHTDRAEFKVSVAGISGTDNPRRHVVNLYMLVGPGDTTAPVITILLQGED